LPKNKKCQFKTDLVKDYACSEPPLEGLDYCIFHKRDKTEEETKLFEEKIEKKLQNKDYNFIGYHFTGRADFSNKVFTEMPKFNEATFEGVADFFKANFNSFAHFVGTTFLSEANFQESTFEDIPSFLGCIFHDLTYFDHANFKKGAYFFFSSFLDEVSFDQSILGHRTIFAEIVFEKEVSLYRSNFEDLSIWSNVTLNHNASAEKFYRIVKNCRQKEGDYTLAGEYYYKERIAKRKQLPRLSFKRWSEYLLLDGLCGYGERPLRAIRTGLGIVFGLAFLYWRVGHIYPSPELFNEPHTLTFWDSLYFSVVTFTTLGFGDWRPDPSHWIRYVVMSEAFIGAFLMALFIVTFARRMMR